MPRLAVKNSFPTTNLHHRCSSPPSALLPYYSFCRDFSSYDITGRKCLGVSDLKSVPYACVFSTESLENKYFYSKIGRRQ